MEEDVLQMLDFFLEFDDVLILVGLLLVRNLLLSCEFFLQFLDLLFFLLDALLYLCEIIMHDLNIGLLLSLDSLL